MNTGNATLKTAEEIIRKRFAAHFGKDYHIQHIESSTFQRNNRNVNYMTVYLRPDSPPLDHSVTTQFDLLLKEELAGHNIRDWPAVAYVVAEANTQ